MTRELLTLNVIGFALGGGAFFGGVPTHAFSTTTMVKGIFLRWNC